MHRKRNTNGRALWTTSAGCGQVSTKLCGQPKKSRLGNAAHKRGGRRVASRGTCTTSTKPQSLKHPPISPSPMPRQGLRSGLQGLVSLSLWYHKDNALKRRRRPQSKIVEMTVSINDLKEASRHISASSRQQGLPFSISKLALKVLYVWTSSTCHHHLSKKLSTGWTQSKSQPSKPSTQLDPMTPTLRVGGQGGSTLLLF